MDGASVGMGAVALVLAGVWAVGRYGERMAPLPYRTTPALRRIGLASMAVGAVELVYAVVVLIADGDVGRCLWYGLIGAVLLVTGKEMRRDSPGA